MLKSCSYCGKIHNADYDCPKKPKKKRYEDTNDRLYKFRQSKAWKQKREQIKDRDLHLCQSCLNKFVDVGQAFINGKGLSVHHIEALVDMWDLRLDDDNLITLCSYCHKLAEDGEIDKDVLIQIVKDKNKSLMK